MTREQKIKAVLLVEHGKPIKQAVELAQMPEIMVVLGREEAERVKATGYTGDLIIVLIDGREKAPSTIDIDFTKND